MINFEDEGKHPERKLRRMALDKDVLMRAHLKRQVFILQNKIKDLAERAQEFQDNLKILAYEIYSLEEEAKIYFKDKQQGE